MKKAILYPLLFAIPVISIAKGEPNLKQQSKPYVFIENRGQMNNHNIDFKIESNGVAVFLESGQLHYLWTKLNASNTTAETYRMDVHLLGANANAKVITEGEQQYYERYFYPSEITAHSYTKIIYKDIYPNIDWVLYTTKTPGNNKGLEYDFIVHPGGNAKNIRLKYDGAISLNLHEGGLVAQTPFGKVAEHKPYSYISETKKRVASSFNLHDNVLSFNVAKTKGTLVIDPVISWATYYGDALVDMFYSLASDAGGNVYAAGYTRSMNSIATTGSFQTMIDGVQDAMLVKFDASGQRLWGTYYGGTGTEMFRSVACDAADNVYAAGQTNSVLGIHTTGAHDTAVNGTDAMLVKFNSAGQRLWGTYYGGTGAETPAYVTCDKNYKVYFCGATTSTTSIASSGITVHDTTYTTSGTNGFLVKFDSAGVRQWGTYYGAGLTEFSTIACDSTGNVFAGGITRATIGIHSPGAQDTTLGSPGINDGFLVKFNTNGIRQWGTYYGGKFADEIRAVSNVKKGHVYIAGSTRSDSSIATPGSFRDTISNLSATDAFIAKISADSGNIKWGTYYGGNLNDVVYSIALNLKDKIFLTGSTGSTNDMATSAGHQPTYGGGTSDAFLLVLDTNGYRHYSSYLGGLGVETGWAVRSAGNGNIYFAGETSSSSGIATVGSHKDTLSGTFQDGFIVKFLEDQIGISRPFPDSALCPGDFLQIGFTTAGNFNTGNNFSVELSDTAGSFLVPVTIGSLSGIGDGVISCQIPFDVKGGNQYSIRVKATNPAYISTDKITSIQIKQGPHKPEIITNAPFCEGHFLSLYAGGTIAGASYVWIGPDNFYYNMQSFTYGTTKLKDAGVFTVTATMNGCSAKDTADVKIYAKSEVLKPTSNSPVCDGEQLALSATNMPVPGVGYVWTGPNGFIDTAISPNRNAISLNAAGVYTVAVDTADLKGCGADTTTVVVTELPEVNAANNGPVDEGEKLMLTATGSVPDLVYNWAGPDSFQSTFQNPEINNITTSAIGAYIVKVSINGCDGFDTTIVVVNKIAKSELRMSPNPSFGSLTLKGTVLSEQTIPLAIINSFGQVAHSDEIVTTNLTFNKTLKITSLPNGVYQVKMKIDNEIKGYEFVLIQK